MAVDTAAKRRSMVSFGDSLVGEQVPAASNLGTAARRGAANFLYAGIDAGAPAAAATNTGGSRRAIAALAMRNAVFTARRGG